MICKVCGAQNEEGSNYCKICAAPLRDSAPVIADESPRFVDPPQEVNAGDMRSSWGFVKAPKWPKPNFDANSIPEEELPEAPVRTVEPVSKPAPVSEPAPYYASAHKKLPVIDRNEYVAAPKKRVAYAEDEGVVSAPRKSAAPVSRGRRFASDEDFGYEEYEESVKMGAAYDMEEEDEDFEPVAPRSRVFSRGKKQRFEPEYEDDYGYEEEDDYDDDFEDDSFRGRRGGSKLKSVLFWVAAVVLVIVIALLALVLVYKDKGGLPAFFGSVFSGSANREPVMEATTMDDGSPAYAVTIYAKDGSIVRFTYPDGETTDITVKNGQAAARVPVSVWTPTEPVESSPVSVKPNFSIVAEDGSVTPVDLPAVEIEVPAITVTMSQPATAELECDTTALAFAGTLSDPTAAIFVNDQQFPVTEDGSFSGTYELGSTGTHNVVFEGRKGGCVIGRHEVVVTVAEAPEEPVAPQPEEVPASGIALAEDGVLRSTGSTLTVKGTMEVGATITATGDVSGEPTVDSANGTFSFTAKTPDTGKQYKVTITATKDGKATTKEFHIERAPDYKDYVESAWRMDYDHIVSVPTQSQGYACKGTIVEIIESSREKVLAKMDVGGGDLVVIEYHPAYATAGTIAVSDNNYTIFAYPNGKHDSGLPLMYAWFVND
ncbi:MAG: hypothetical protein IJP37_02790 [Clostridia bacterium]|nr:hypothetical protein [Clostridia bacterium]